MTPFLSAPRIHLCHLAPEDAESYYAKLNDQETTKWMQQGIYPMTIDKCREFIQNVKGLHLGIVVSDRHIGNITLSNIHDTFRTAEISIILWDERGKGYGTEAIKALVNHAFTRMNLNRIQAGAVMDNIGCIKAFEKAGFTREGVCREAYYCEGRYRDVVIMGLLKREWGGEKCYIQQ